MLKTQQIALAAMLLSVTGLGGRIAFAADGPTDPQIVGIVLAADQIDIDYGKIALSKSKNKQVREFPNRMVTDHSAVQENVIALADKLDHPAVFTSKRPYALDFQSTRATSNASSTNKIYQGANQKISMMAIMILTMAILPLLEILGERLISQADTSA